MQLEIMKIILAPVIPDAPVAPEGPIADPLALFFKTLYESVRSGNWWLVAALTVSGATLLARKHGGKVWPWLDTGEAGSLLTLLFAVSGAFANALAAGQEPSVDLLFWGLQVGLAASGGYSMARTLTKAARKRKQKPQEKTNG